MNIGVIGAGITGLVAAYELTKRGHSVVVYEAQEVPGGLAAGFRDASWEWHLDRFYHHWFASDRLAVRLVDELGMRSQLFFPWPTTSVYHRGRLYPLDGPVPALAFVPVAAIHRAVHVLQFKPLPFADRLRAGLVGAYLTLNRNWRPLERVTADAWMRRTVGERAYEILWKPLLLSKFGEENYRDVNMAWMWARLYKRTARLGYLVGGFQALVDRLVERIEKQGGKVQLKAPVHRVRPANGRLRLELVNSTTEHERVIATVSPQETLRIVPDLPEAYRAQLSRLRSMGTVVLILALRHPLTEGHYWINLPKAEGIPFMGLVEHTNYISREHYGGDHLVYCGDYLPSDHPYFEYSAEQLLEVYWPGLLKINPHLQRTWVRAIWKFGERYTQPIPPVNYSKDIPSLRTGVDGLWLANMSQVYPWDRGTNYAIELAYRVVQEVTQ